MLLWTVNRIKYYWLSLLKESLEAYSYKKVHHKKYIECKIDLLCNIVAPFLTTFHFFIGCVNKINDEWCNAEDKDENHLKKYNNRTMSFMFNHSSESWWRVFYAYTAELWRTCKFTEGFQLRGPFKELIYFKVLINFINWFEFK